MSLTVFPHALLDPLLAGFSYTSLRDVLKVTFGRGLYEQRADRGQRNFRAWDVEYIVPEALRQTFETFLAGVANSRDAFLWRDPLDNVRTGVSIGTSVALQTVFNLPTTGAGGGDYPRDTPLTVLYDDGVAVAKTVQTDARTITANSAPTASSVMTADVEFLKRVRLDVEPRWSLAGDGAAFHVALTLREVPA